MSDVGNSGTGYHLGAMPRFVVPMLLFALLACGSAFVVLSVGSPKPQVVFTRPPRPIQTYVAMTKAIEGMDVSAEVDSAVRRGDRRLAGIGGYGGVIPPGVEDYMERREYYLTEYGVRWYTSDSDEQDQLQVAAARFAERYNRLLLERTSSSFQAATVPAP